MMKVTFNFHSCFTVELDRHVFIFDYFYPADMPQGADSDGKLTLNGDKRIFVLSSHGHIDHHSDKVFNWRNKYPDISYVMDSGIKVHDKRGVTFVSPDNEYDIGGVHIRTLGSTDQGVAYLVTCEGRTFFHAGDLAWWYWEKKGEDYVKLWGDNYRREIEKVAGLSMDAAFLVIDPRLRPYHAAGFNMFLDLVPDCKHAFPMHLFRRLSLIREYLDDEANAAYRDRVVNIEYEGQEFELS